MLSLNSVPLLLLQSAPLVLFIKSAEMDKKFFMFERVASLKNFPFRLLFIAPGAAFFCELF